MPTLVGAALMALGGFMAMRVIRREWSRVNRTMDEQRATPTAQRRQAKKLERDPETGAYRPADD